MSNLNYTSTSISKAELAGFLKERAATVTFTKKDGTTRNMYCTLQEGVVVPHEKKTDRTKEPSDSILPVWDLEANAWRSINIETIQYVVCTDADR
jgi:hypothetical protein